MAQVMSPGGNESPGCSCFLWLGKDKSLPPASLAENGLMQAAERKGPGEALFTPSQALSQGRGAGLQGLALRARTARCCRRSCAAMGPSKRQHHQRHEKLRVQAEPPLLQAWPQHTVRFPAIFTESMSTPLKVFSSPIAGLVGR